MKTVGLKTGGVQRLSDQAAELLVSRGAATYAPKAEWKAQKNAAFQERALELLSSAPRRSRRYRV